MGDKVNILLVDDQPAKLLSYEAVLRELGENLLTANSAKEAFEHLLRNDIAVVLVDVYMPDLDGFELARMIRDHPRFQETAIIFISAVLSTDFDFLRGYQAGAVDYVPVPVVPEILRAKVKVFAELYRKSRELERLNRQLEQRVAERTAALEASTQQLRQSEERLHLALEAARMGWWDCELGTGRVTWSSNLGRIMGFEPDHFGSNLEGLMRRVHPDDREKFRRLVELGTADQTCELRFLRPDGSARWSLAAGSVSRDSENRPVRFVGVDLDITARKEAEERQELLVRELDHRAKNLLAVVQSILRLSKAETTNDFVAAVIGRIKALSLAHSLLSASRWQGVELGRMVEEEMFPFLDGGVPRVRSRGPAVSLLPATAQALAMTLHELATNAVKYGALSAPQGRVELDWDYDSTGLRLHWVETGGPPVSAPVRLGFGTKAITGNVERQLSGQVDFSWAPEGLRVELSIPSDRFHMPSLNGARGPLRNGANEAAEPVPLSGNQILLVEDEALIGAMLKELLCELGFQVLGPVGELAEAVELASRAEVAAACLDVNLGGIPVYPVAEALEARGIPFVFVTGYSPSGIDRRYAHIPVLGKPVDAERLRELLAGRRYAAEGLSEARAAAAL